ncbi:hypothetical protein APHAL10511_003938 [Amanita phalloides]|nr:hypothetical protein APHAL10511_003938 [Amanita phalloides]
MLNLSDSAGRFISLNPWKLPCTIRFRKKNLEQQQDRVPGPEWWEMWDKKWRELWYGLSVNQSRSDRLHSRLPDAIPSTPSASSAVTIKG